MAVAVGHDQRWRHRVNPELTDAGADLRTSRAGKSYLAGLMAERLIAQGYCVLVVDPEGDCLELGRLRGVAVVDGRNGLPEPKRVAAMFSHRYSSVVLDLCEVEEHDRHPYLERLAAAVDESRAAHGLPHWIVDDEAHSTKNLLGPDSLAVAGSAYTGPWGSCLVTYRPDLIDASALDRLDAVIYVGVGQSPSSDIVDLLARVSSRTQADVLQELTSAQPEDAYLAVRPDIGPSTAFSAATRVTEHRRHWHKYTDATLPPWHRFYFRDGHDAVVEVAPNLRRLRSVMAHCAPQVIEHHAAGHDFSRWINEVFSDTYLATQLGVVEDQWRRGASARKMPGT